MDEDDHAYRICPYAASVTCYDVETRDSRYIAQGCRRWTCDVCGPRRKAELVRRIRTGEPNRFLTLTCRHEETPAHQLQIIRRGLPRLITKLRAAYGEVEYVRMLETCNDGYPHFHLLVRSTFIPQPDVAARWKTLTGAHIVDIRKAHGKSLSYIAKYIGKARDAEGTFGRQRLSVSRQFWIPREGESQFIGFDHQRTHPEQYAAEHPDRHYDRMRPGLYADLERVDGDETPTELQSTARR